MGNSRGKRGILNLSNKRVKGCVITEEGKRVTVKAGGRLPSKAGIIWITNDEPEKGFDFCEKFMERKGK